MKIFKIICILVCFSFVFSVKTYADNQNSDLSLIPKEQREILNDYGLNEEKLTESLDTKGFFSLLTGFFNDGIKSPFSVFLKSLATVIVASLLTSYCEEGKTGLAVESVCSLSSALVLTLPVYEIIVASSQALKGATAFITASVPVFASLKASAGKSLSVTGGAGVLLIACQVLSFLCSFVIAPFMNGYLSLAVCSSFGINNKASGLINGIKKAAMWFLSLCASVFVFILSSKSVLGKTADTVALKTAKYVLGSFVPVVGSTLSESAVAVASSLNAVSGSVGMYIIIGLIILILPVLIELLCWKLSLILLSNTASLFSANSVKNLSEAVENVISLLLGFLLLSVCLFIISVGVLISL